MKRARALCPFALIGDSVAEGASYYWIPAVFPDSLPTRSWAFLREGDVVYRKDLAQGHDGHSEVLHGGNGPITSVGLRPLSPRRRGAASLLRYPYEHPIPFQDENNALMYKLAEKYPQVRYSRLV